MTSRRRRRVLRLRPALVIPLPERDGVGAKFVLLRSRVRPKGHGRDSNVNDGASAVARTGIVAMLRHRSGVIAGIMNKLIVFLVFSRLLQRRSCNERWQAEKYHNKKRRTIMGKLSVFIW
jgi:hypothetical protein